MAGGVSRCPEAGDFAWRPGLYRAFDAGKLARGHRFRPADCAACHRIWGSRHQFRPRSGDLAAAVGTRCRVRCRGFPHRHGRLSGCCADGLPPGPHDVVFLWVSPFFGMFLPMGWLIWFNYPETEGFIVMPVWIVLTSATAYTILRATIASFDRLLGRMPVVRTRD